MSSTASSSSSSSSSAWQLWHNPSCSKSRAALSLVSESRHVDQVRVVPYLETFPAAEDLAVAASILGADLVRLPKLHPTKGQDVPMAVMLTLLEDPTLMQRPVLFRPAGEGGVEPVAVIGRPPDKILETLDEHSGDDKDE